VPARDGDVRGCTRREAVAARLYDNINWKLSPSVNVPCASMLYRFALRLFSPNTLDKPKKTA
jgi:hypothetical protein